MKSVIITMRPWQWIKNLILFAGLVFALEAGIVAQLLVAFAAFVSFCLLSSAVYAFNDICDLKRDRAHPLKSARPLASGQLSMRSVAVLAVLLAFSGLAAAYSISINFLAFGLIYLLVQAVYSLWLKQKVILDVMAISAGFVIRAMAGAVAINVEISHWLLICTMLLALFLALAKRRSELLNTGTGLQREILDEYTPGLLDMMIAISTSIALVSYVLYTVSPETTEKFQTDQLVYTTPFVIYGLFRYLYLVYVKNEGEMPTALILSDFPMILNLILWLTAVVWIIY